MKTTRIKARRMVAPRDLSYATTDRESLGVFLQPASHRIAGKLVSNIVPVAVIDVSDKKSLIEQVTDAICRKKALYSLAQARCGIAPQAAVWSEVYAEAALESLGIIKPKRRAKK